MDITVQEDLDEHHKRLKMVSQEKFKKTREIVASQAVDTKAIDKKATDKDAKDIEGNGDTTEDDKLGILNRLLDNKFKNQKELNADSIRLKKNATISICMKNIQDEIIAQNPFFLDQISHYKILVRNFDLAMLDIKYPV